MSTAAMCVVIMHSYIADIYGRKMNVIIISFLEAVSWIIRIFCSSFTSLIIARVCAGIAAGGCYNVVPMYIKEISREDLRGVLCTFSMIFQTVGVFIMYCIGAYLSYYTVIYAVVGLPIVTMLGMIFAPESPEFLVKQGKIEKAIDTVAYVRGLDRDDTTVQTLVETMTKDAAHFESLPKLTLLSIFNCTHLAYGLECGWISPTTQKLQSETSPSGYPLSDGQVAWVASCMSTAAMCVVIMHSYIADIYGRKMNVIIISFLEAVSWIIRIFCSSFTSLIIARVCAGIAAGGCYNVVPMYIKEISREDLRGVLCTFSMIFQTVGVFIMYCIGAYLSYYTVIYAVVGLPIVTMLGMIFAPESPEFLVKQGKIEKAIDTVAYVRGLDRDDTTVQTLVETMTKDAAHFESLPKLTLLSILKNKIWRRGYMLIMIAFTFFEVNGAFAIITYASTVINSTGIDFEISPEIQSLSFPVVMMIGSLTLASCIERFGRKPLLIGAYIVTSCCMFGIAIIIVLHNQIGGVPGWLPVLLMMLVVAMFSGGVCPVTYIILTEMFNFQIRAKLMSLVVTYGWFLTAVSLNVYMPLSNALGVHAPFIFFGFVNLGGAFFTTFYLTETKGKTETQILQDLMGKKTDNTTKSIE